MRTENDLRVALQHQADQSSEAAPALIARALADQHRHSPIRARLSIAVAVAIVAALLAAPLVIRQAVRHSTAPHPSPVAPSPLLNQASALSWVTTANSNYRIGRTLTVGSTVEILQIQAGDYGQWALADFAPGTFDTSLVAHATPTVVDGHPGYFAKATKAAPGGPLLLSPLVNGSFAHGHGYFSTVAWQLASDHWVMLDRIWLPDVSADPSASEADLLNFALTLHVKVRTEPVRQVFRVGYLPGTGWRLKSLMISDTGDIPLDSLRDVVLVRGSLTVQISVARYYPTLAPDYSDPQRIVGDYIIQIDRNAYVGRNPFDAATTQRILDSVTLAAHPVTEDDSWFPISSLLPGN